MKYCPCGSKNRYLDCCGAYILKRAVAPTPEALMRSRYTAYVEGKIDYIQKTMKGPALLNFDKKSAKEKVEWLGLEVVSSLIDSTDPSIGYVEFKAKYRKDNQEYCIHENSKFNKMDGKWYYISGEFIH